MPAQRDADSSARRHLRAAKVAKRSQDAMHGNTAALPRGAMELLADGAWLREIGILGEVHLRPVRIVLPLERADIQSVTTSSPSLSNVSLLCTPRPPSGQWRKAVRGFCPGYTDPDRRVSFNPRSRRERGATLSVDFQAP